MLWFSRSTVAVAALALASSCATAPCPAPSSQDEAQPACAQQPAVEDKAVETLPPPARPFEGTIGHTIADSKADYPKPVRAPEGAPNVLLVLLDDVGFGHAATFGGAAETPTLDRLAKGGLRYNMFHTTALCSPTRAALLTGRNHHTVGTGVIIELGTGYPGYTGIVPNSTAGLPELLRQNGYATAAFGKWHNTPDVEISPSGPFDRWPTGKTWGFDYFYGFMNGETSQYYPVLYRNTQPVPPPATPEQGYHLTEDIADEAISFMNRVNAADPEKPWFVYFSTGAAHAPHHAPKAYRDKYKGKFDAGWDAYREATFARQKQLGVIPEDAELTPRPEQLPAWDDQPEEAKRVYRRLMENYTGFLEHTDVQIGRVIDAIEARGELDNTLIIYVVGDNGASGEGGLEGTVNEVASLNGVQLGLDGLKKFYDQIGGPETEPHVPAAWAWAANTPFRWTKQVASHFGGTRNPVVISWPKRMQQAGGVRSQFHHVIDVAPTVLEAAGIREAEVVNGVKQKPIEGVSMLYTLSEPQAPSKHTVQYFEMLGNRGVYKDGFIASARHGRLPWETAGESTPFDADTWELYDLSQDFTQAHDLASEQPGKVAELKALFEAEATSHQVFPLDDRMAARFDASLRPNPLHGRKSMTYGPGVENLNESMVLGTQGHSFTVKAALELAGPAEGVVSATGGGGGGWSLYVHKNRPVFAYNFFGVERYRFAGKQPLPRGAVSLRAEVVMDDPGPGKPAKVTLFVNDQPVAEGAIEHTVPMRFGVEPFDVGADNVSSVGTDYKSPSRFTGEIKSVTVEIP